MAAGVRCARAGTRRRRSLRAVYAGVPSTLQGAALRWSKDNRHRWLQGNRTRVRALRGMKTQARATGKGGLRLGQARLRGPSRCRASAQKRSRGPPRGWFRRLLQQPPQAHWRRRVHLMRGGRPWQGECGLRTDPTRALKETLPMTLGGSRTLGDRDGGPCARGLVTGRLAWRWDSRSSPTAGQEGGTRGEEGAGREGLTLNSSGPRGHATCSAAKRSSCILPAPGPRPGGSALPERGRGTVSWKTCLAFSSVRSYPGHFSLLCVPLGEALRMPCLSLRKRQVELQGTGAPHFVCSTDPTSLHSRLWVPPIRTLNDRSSTTPPLCIQISYSSGAEGKPSGLRVPPPMPTPKLTPRDGSTKRTRPERLGCGRPSNWEQRSNLSALPNLIHILDHSLLARA